MKDIKREQETRIETRSRLMDARALTEETGDAVARDAINVALMALERSIEENEPSPDGHCDSCGREGTMEETLAPGQYRCPTDREECNVVTFRDDA